MRLSFLSKLTLNHYTIAGAAIFAIIVVHFVLQFTFIQSENFRSALISIPPEPIKEKSVEIKTINEPIKLDIVTIPKTAAPTVSPPQRKILTPQTVVKKKEPRESRAERLRRAEKILTGV
ncbi:MAG TPA: hypothetical protein VK892_14230 [Pyrinomonadaceae bacterium]|nr:hypothetical protein [Pyrinomonadaceae bacterium]